MGVDYIEHLVETIKKYGQHLPDCIWLQGYDCSCGFGEVQDEFKLDKGRY